MSVVHTLRSERLAMLRREALEQPNLRTVDQLSPALKVEKYVLLTLDGKLLGPELSRIRSEMALPLERLDVELPPDLPRSYLSRQRRSLPAFPLSSAKSPQRTAGLRSPRRSMETLCTGHFPPGLSQLVTGLRGSVSPSPRGTASQAAQPRAPLASVPGSKAKAGEAACQGRWMQPELDGKQPQAGASKGACEE